MVDYLPFIIFLMILAVFLRAESALTVIYMVVGTFVLGFWWNKRAFRHVEVTRDHPTHVYIGDRVPVQISIKNKSILPILWLEIHEGLHVDLRGGKSIKKVFSLASREETTIQYELNPHKRGYYHIGPMQLSSGDPLGLLQPTQKEVPGSPITVYPLIMPMSALSLPSQSPFGTIKHHNPIFEDPNRILSKRDYQIGDSIRHIDWKATAATGQLQVNTFEAAISLEVFILLDLHPESYAIKTFVPASELAITAAASVAAWGHRHQQLVGLMTNGIDPESAHQTPLPLDPQKGASHFIRILEVLARVQAGQQQAIENLIHDAFTSLSWGATLVLISGGLHESTLTQLFQARKRGVNPAIILTSQLPNYWALKNLSEYYKIKLYRASFPEDIKTLGLR